MLSRENISKIKCKPFSKENVSKIHLYYKNREINKCNIKIYEALMEMP